MMRTSWMLFVLLAVVLLVPFTAMATPVGIVTAIEGRADITRSEDPARPAIVGDEVYMGDFLRTLSKSRMEVTFLDDSVTRLAPLSRLRVTEFLFDASERKGTFDLLRGTVQNVVASSAPDSYFEVNTPTAVAGVRGTRFFVYFRDGVTGGASREGTFYVYSKGRPDQVRFVDAGQAFLVPSIDDIPLIRPSSEEELQRFIDDTTPGDGEGPAEETDETGGTVGDDIEEGAASGDLFPDDQMNGLNTGSNPMLAFETTITDPLLLEQQLSRSLVEVGMTSFYTVAYGGEGVEIFDVTMDEVRFFSYSTGDSPVTWSTGTVNGYYDWSSPVGAYADLESADGMNAYFEITQWGDNQWEASIDGSGQMEGWPSAIDFTGSGSGSYVVDGAEGDWSYGTFSGAAEGTATAME